MARIPVIREDDGELLGFVADDATGWTAQTIFGYVFARSKDRALVENAVREQGLSMLMGVWQYYDTDDKTWYPCLLKEVFEKRVIVIRANEMGYEDPDTYKRVVILNPNETNLVKS
jgi:hypothetical protein